MADEGTFLIQGRVDASTRRRLRLLAAGKDQLLAVAVGETIRRGLPLEEGVPGEAVTLDEAIEVLESADTPTPATIHRLGQLLLRWGRAE